MEKEKRVPGRIRQFLLDPKCRSGENSDGPRLSSLDFLILAVLFVAAFLLSFVGTGTMDPIVYDKSSMSVWFQGDVYRGYECMTNRSSPMHYRAKVHPLFALATHACVFIMTRAFGMPTMTAVRVTVAVVAGLLISAMYMVLRFIVVRRTDAVLFTALAGASASVMFWCVVPETYPLGLLSILLALLYVLAAERRRVSPFWTVCVSAATLSFTVTNWMTGILASFATVPWRKALNVTVYALAVVTVLFGVEKFFIPSSEFFLGSREETRYLFLPESGGAACVARSFLFHSVVMPELQTSRLPELDRTILTVQRSPVASASGWGRAASILWGLMLAAGVLVMVLERRNARLRLVLALTLLGQLLLHLVYGEETFLYSLHFGPLLVLVASFGVLTRARRVVMGTAVVLLGLLLTNNLRQLRAANDFLAHRDSARSQVLRMMIRHPEHAWPRGEGHVILAVPGSGEKEKSYHEPGGSFSPSVGSFGVSVWVTDRAGNVIVTSDNIPLEKIHQRFDWTGGGGLPSIVTETPYYRSTWSRRPGDWTLSLEKPAGADTTDLLVVRSVGPAGGPVRRLEWDGNRLLVNSRWRILADPPPSRVRLGSEFDAGGDGEGLSPHVWTDEGGWGCARLELSGTGRWRVGIEDPLISGTAGAVFEDTEAGLSVDLPDRRFADCLNAQVAHLMMGLVDNQTRPGDPMNYSLTWLRDGAYVITALARSGKQSTAERLAPYFAENDFFGGFGPEADAPGLAIWALECVARQVNRDDFDRRLWPHISRKAELIMSMLSASKPVREPLNGPVVPRMREDPQSTLVCEAARDGLIVGKMDNHRPLLFVNAVSYRGLKDAAALARRLGKTEEAERWGARADRLAKAWASAFRPPHSGNPRTYICGFWPTWVAVPVLDAYREELDRRWDRLRGVHGEFEEPQRWTYFDLAEAHQWLFLGRPDRAWDTLRWFWEKQSSPGLYTWWEGAGEENGLGLWEDVRGWVAPQCVTPHYWTAAEMLLLQLDMLAYVDEGASEPVLVIGAGVPKEWLNFPLSAKDLRTRAGQVDWSWKDGRLSVTVRGSRCLVKAGPVFGTGVSPVVVYQDEGRFEGSAWRSFAGDAAGHGLCRLEGGRVRW